MRQRGTNQTGNLLNLGRVDPKGSSDNISGQTKDCWTKERVSIASGGKFRTTGERRDTHIVERYNERERAVSQTREHAEVGMEGNTDTWLKRGVSSGMGDKKGKIYLTPGEESRKDATKVTDSQLSLYSKWMEPWGKRAAWLALTSLKMNLAPSSRIIPVIRDPLVT